MEGDELAFCRQEHPVVELIGDRTRQVFEGDEVENIMVDIKCVFHLDGNPVIMPVDSFTLIIQISDEVSRAEDEVVFTHANFVGRARQWG